MRIEVRNEAEELLELIITNTVRLCIREMCVKIPNEGGEWEVFNYIRSEYNEGEETIKVWIPGGKPEEEPEEPPPEEPPTDEPTEPEEPPPDEPEEPPVIICK